MNAETRAQLNALNRDFYRTRAAEFSDSRDHPWPGWDRVIAHLREGSAPSTPHPLRVLDAGCGNGRFARHLVETWTGPISYRGIDSSEALLAVARDRLRDRPDLRCQLHCVDILDPGASDALPEGEHECVVAFGLLHHVPGAVQRRALVHGLSERVAIGGWLAVSAWQFARSERLLRRVVPWTELRAHAPIDSAELEPGDYLLPFGDREAALRYCHHCDESELEALAKVPGPPSAWRLERFDADGRSGDLNHYLVWQRLA
jgi:SAM-dependent methyltransferase